VSVRNNLVANLLGRMWMALMSVAFVPFYIRFLGIESYALIGFFAAMMATFAVLDFGLGVTANRELARMTGRMEEEGPRARDFFRTVEIIYWLVAALIGAIIFVLSPFIARDWLNTQNLDVAEATHAIRLMAVVAMLRWPVSIYCGALTGLHRQVTLNVVSSIFATIAGAGAVLVLWRVSDTLSAFLTWQILATAAQVACLRAICWRDLRLEGHRPRARYSSIRGTIGFSAGITGIALLSVVLTQLDKFLLSNMLPLQQFGYYALAAAIASMIPIVGSAVENATFPSLAHLHANGRGEEIAALYHRASSSVAILVIPLSTTLALFAREALEVYLHDTMLAENTHLLLSLLVIGNCILALMYMPFSLQLSHGWTRLSFYKNIVAVTVFVPALIVMVSWLGAVGAALVWIGLTLGYFLIEVQLMHRRLLRGEQWKWYLVDVGLPLAVSVGLLVPLRLLLEDSWELWVKTLIIGAVAFLALLCSALAASEPRQMVITFARRLLARQRVRMIS
jgi:O-antigen/teichoic acid export membrane protein